ncbi:restriction endonuclease subunit S [Aeromonas veronii]
MRPLGDLCDFLSGFAFKSGDLKGDSGIPVVKIKNVNNKVVTLEDMQFFPEEKLDEKIDRFLLNDGDVLIAMTGQGSVGRVGRLRIPENTRLLLNQRVGKFIAKEGIANLDYIYYVVSSDKYESVLFNAASGSGQPNLSPATIKSILVPYTPYKEQVKIAQVLTVLDDKITLNRQINQTLEQMAQALFKSWFVDFDPVIDNALDAGFFEQDLAFSDELLRRAEARRAEREHEDFKQLPEATRQLFPAAFEACAEPSLGLGGWVPQGWRSASLDTIANFQNGLALQNFRPDSEQDEYLPVLKIAQLRQGYCDDEERARTDIKESCRVYDGDMIFSWSGTLMIDIWTGGSAALNQHLFKVTSSKYPMSFYYHWTNHHLARFQHIAAAKAVTMGHIKKGDLSDSYCTVPSILIITEFERIAGACLNQAKNLRLQNNSLAKLRDTLLPKLISGELRLDNIEADLTKVEVA